MNRETMEPILKQLVSEGLLAPEQLDKVWNTPDRDAGTQTPWFVQALVGFSAWLAALLFLVFAYGTRLISSSESAMVLGAVMCVGAVAMRWLPGQSVFIAQLALALSVAGQCLLVIGICDYRFHRITVAALTVIAMQLVLIPLYPDALHRFLSTIAAALATTVLCYDLEVKSMVYVVLTLFAAASLAIWQTRDKWLANRIWADILQPVAYGLPAALMSVLIFTVMEKKMMPDAGWWPASLGIAAVLFYLEYRILQAQGLAMESKSSIVVLLGTAVLVWAAADSPGLLVSLLVLLIGFQYNDRLLLALSFCFLAYFISCYYYALQMTLLMKSATLFGTGVVLLVVRALLAGKQEPAAGSEPAPARSQQPPAPRHLLIALFLLLALAAINGFIAGKERVIAHGLSVFIELGPRDPRSLIQGDYMALRYRTPDFLNADEVSRDGHLVFTVNERNIAHFVRIYDAGTPLAAGEHLLRYRKRSSWSVRLGAEAFFFQEGNAGLYESARYGELRVESNGNSVLIGLRNENMEPLGPARR